MPVEFDLFEQGSADGLQDAALDLRPHAVGADDLAAVMRAGDARDLDVTARGIDGDFHGHGDVGFLPALVLRIGDATSLAILARSDTCIPFEQIGGTLEAFAPAWIAEVAETECKWILICQQWL